MCWRLTRAECGLETEQKARAGPEKAQSVTTGLAKGQVVYDAAMSARPRRRRFPALAAVAAGALPAVSLLPACGSGEPQSPEPSLNTSIQAESVDQVAQSTCDTPLALVSGLSRQLVDAINCLRPGTLVDIPLGGDIEMLHAGRPNLIDGRALADLRAAAAAGNQTMVIRWAYRDVGLQQLFWLQDQYQGCAVAAQPGNSNHQNGLAVDLDDRAYWEPIMRAHGWENNLPNDTVHFDYQRAADVGLGSLSLYAFQELWNLNHPADLLPLTGELDAATDAALAGAPIEGFAADLCQNGVPPPGPGPAGGPTVGQSAWRSCDLPEVLAAGLARQIARGMNCLQPDALSPLPVCAGPGCVVADAPPLLSTLAAPAATHLLQASTALRRGIHLSRALRDVATGHLLALSAERIACPAAPAAARGTLDTGLAVDLGAAANGATTNALTAAGFVADATDGPGIWRYAGADAADLTSLNVLAFQQLWNLNRPDDPIDADGRIGPQTRGAIERSPVDGFPEELCPDPMPPVGPDAGAPPPGADAGGVGPGRDAGGSQPDPDGGAGTGGTPGTGGQAAGGGTQPPTGDAGTGGGSTGGSPGGGGAQNTGGTGQGTGGTPHPGTDAGPGGLDLGVALSPERPQPPLEGWTGAGSTGCSTLPKPTTAPGGWMACLGALGFRAVRRRRHTPR